MSTSTPLELERPLRALASPIAPARRRRVLISAGLAVFAVAFVIVMFAIFGVVALASCLPPLAAGLLLLWQSADVLRSDECAAAAPAAAAA